MSLKQPVFMLPVCARVESKGSEDTSEAEQSHILTGQASFILWHFTFSKELEVFVSLLPKCVWDISSSVVFKPESLVFDLLFALLPILFFPQPNGTLILRYLKKIGLDF